jgi:hypothetical protein
MYSSTCAATATALHMSSLQTRRSGLVLDRVHGLGARRRRRAAVRLTRDQPVWKFVVAVNNMLVRVRVWVPRGSFNSAGSTA